MSVTRPHTDKAHPLHSFKRSDPPTPRMPAGVSQVLMRVETGPRRRGPERAASARAGEQGPQAGQSQAWGSMCPCGRVSGREEGIQKEKGGGICGPGLESGYPCEPLIPNTHRHTENRPRLCACVCGQRAHVHMAHTQDAPRKA